MAAPTDLLFRPDDREPLHLVFGDAGGGGAPQYAVSMAGRVSGIRGRVRIHSAYAAAAAGRISGLRGTMAVAYDANVERPQIAWRRATQQQAQPLLNVARSGWQDANRLSVSLRTVAQVARPLLAAVRPSWQNTLPLVRAVRSVDQPGRPVAMGTRAGFQQAIALSTAARAVSQPGRPVALGVRAGFQQTIQISRTVRESFEPGRPLLAMARIRMQQGMPLLPSWRVRFQTGRHPSPGASPRPDPERQPWCYTPALPIELLFKPDELEPLHLLFLCDRHGSDPEPGETIVIPVRRTYIVINDITLYRVDSGVELQADSFSMSLDYQSWTWSWNASLDDGAAPHLGRDSAGDPAELAVFVNGIEFRLRLESRARDRRFNPTKWAVSGRGKASVLGASDTPKQSFRNLVDRTAQQLIADVLTVNGVPMGWSVDWGLEDWLVPAGAWAVHGTYMDAINDIAGAAGGYVQPHNTAATLRILPRYPLAPWNWSSITPAFEIPADAAEVEGTEFIDKPAYNRVFVGGISTGVFGPYTRAGSAGNVIAPQVNHALITHADVHRQRGMAELSDTGKQQRLTLSMQVLPTSGVIVPGQFVRYLGDSPVMGIVRRTAVGGLPRLRQTLEIEVHA